MILSANDSDINLVPFRTSTSTCAFRNDCWPLGLATYQISRRHNYVRFSHDSHLIPTPVSTEETITTYFAPHPGAFGFSQKLLE